MEIVFLLLFLILGVIIFGITVYTIFVMFKLSDKVYPGLKWLAFVPGFNSILLLKLYADRPSRFGFKSLIATFVGLPLVMIPLWLFATLGNDTGLLSILIMIAYVIYVIVINVLYVVLVLKLVRTYTPNSSYMAYLVLYFVVGYLAVVVWVHRHLDDIVTYNRNRSDGEE